MAERRDPLGAKFVSFPSVRSKRRSNLDRDVVFAVLGRHGMRVIAPVGWKRAKRGQIARHVVRILSGTPPPVKFAHGSPALVKGRRRDLKRIGDDMRAVLYHELAKAD